MRNNFDEVTIITRPPGFFRRAATRTFKADMVTVRKAIPDGLNASCSTCSWEGNDEVYVDATGEVIRGRVIDYYTEGEYYYG